MADIIQQRRDTAARWAQYNPILMEGEVGYVTDNPNQYKIGNGRDKWNDLPLRGYTGTITQDTGDDENAVMSQKAVTDKLSELGSELCNRSISFDLSVGETYISNDDKIYCNIKKGERYSIIYNTDIESLGTIALLLKVDGVDVEVGIEKSVKKTYIAEGDITELGVYVAGAEVLSQGTVCLSAEWGMIYNELLKTIDSLNDKIGIEESRNEVDKLYLALSGTMAEKCEVVLYNYSIALDGSISASAKNLSSPPIYSYKKQLQFTNLVIGDKFAIYYYDNNNTLKKRSDWGNFDSDTLELGATGEFSYIRISIQKSDESDVSAIERKIYVQDIYLESTDLKIAYDRTKITDSSNAISNITPNIPIVLHNEVFTNTSSEYSVRHLSSDYIYCNFDKIDVSGWVEGDEAIVYFYSSNKTYLSKTTWSSYNEGSKLTIDTTQNSAVYYVRILMDNTNSYILYPNSRSLTYRKHSYIFNNSSIVPVKKYVWQKGNFRIDFKLLGFSKNDTITLKITNVDSITFQNILIRTNFENRTIRNGILMPNQSVELTLKLSLNYDWLYIIPAGTGDSDLLYNIEVFKVEDVRDKQPFIIPIIGCGKAIISKADDRYCHNSLILHYNKTLGVNDYLGQFVKRNSYIIYQNNRIGITENAEGNRNDITLCVLDRISGNRRYYTIVSDLFDSYRLDEKSVFAAFNHNGIMKDDKKIFITFFAKLVNADGSIEYSRVYREFDCSDESLGDIGYLKLEYNNQILDWNWVNYVSMLNQLYGYNFDLPTSETTTEFELNDIAFENGYYYTVTAHQVNNNRDTLIPYVLLRSADCITWTPISVILDDKRSSETSVVVKDGKVFCAYRTNNIGTSLMVVDINGNVLKPFTTISEASSMPNMTILRDTIVCFYNIPPKSNYYYYDRTVLGVGVIDSNTLEFNNIATYKSGCGYQYFSISQCGGTAYIVNTENTDGSASGNTNIGPFQNVTFAEFPMIEYID